MSSVCSERMVNTDGFSFSTTRSSTTTDVWRAGMRPARTSRIEAGREQASQDERELRQLMDALPQHVLVLDKDGALLQANRTMLDYKGYTLEEMKGVGTRERNRQRRSSRRPGESRGRTTSRSFEWLSVSRWKNGCSVQTASFAGSCFATTQSWTKTET